MQVDLLGVYIIGQLIDLLASLAGHEARDGRGRALARGQARYVACHRARQTRLVLDIVIFAF